MQIHCQFAICLFDRLKLSEVENQWLLGSVDYPYKLAKPSFKYMQSY